MLKNLCQLEHIVEDKVFRFVCENDAPIHFIKEAMFQMQKYIGQIEDAALAQNKLQEEANNPAIDPIQLDPLDEPKPVAELNESV